MTAHADALLESALHYASRFGWPVFPVYPIRRGRCACPKDCGRDAGKHPIGALAPHGLLNATTDVAIIRGWWASWADANVGIRTGAESGLLVVDLDPEKGGPEAWAALVARSGPMPETVEAISGSLGRHLYVKHPGRGHDLRNTEGVLAAGVDTRGDGGYVVAPPSGHRLGRRYEWDLLHHPDEHAIASMPDWLLRLVRTGARAEGADNGHRTAEDWAALLQGAPDGKRHHVAVRIAGHFLGLGIAAVEVEQILVNFGARCAPPADPKKLRQIVQDLAAKDAAKGADTPPDQGLGLVAVGELLGEPDSGPAWLVEGRLPAGGLGLLAGKPKAGKSTLARCLALRVARGEAWLGQATQAGPVIYLALEEKRQEVRAHFRALGATGADPIYILCATAPQDALARLRVEVARRHPVLIIIDPLFKLVRVPSERGNDYATMSAALEPLLQLARETGAHVLAVHHLGKGARDDGDAILGSTAIFAAVDTALLLKRSARYRTLSSLQRYGDDLEEITLRLDPDTRDVALGLPRAEAEQADAGRLILDYLATIPAPATEPDVADSIECRTAPQRAALRALVREGRVARSGRGAKGDPFRYALAREQASPRTPDPAPGEGACSLVPIDTREQGNKRTVPSETAVPKSADSCSRVPSRVPVPGVPVPETPERLA